MNKPSRTWFLIMAVLIPFTFAAIPLLTLTEVIGDKLAFRLYFSIIPLLLFTTIIIGRRMDGRALPSIPTAGAVVVIAFLVIYLWFLM